MMLPNSNSETYSDHRTGSRYNGRAPEIHLFPSKNLVPWMIFDALFPVVKELATYLHSPGMRRLDESTGDALRAPHLQTLGEFGSVLKSNIRHVETENVVVFLMPLFVAPGCATHFPRTTSTVAILRSQHGLVGNSA